MFSARLESHRSVVSRRKMFGHHSSIRKGPHPSRLLNPDEVPINKVPDDVLFEIFLWLKHMPPMHATRPPACPWSPILRVSRRWHDVAFDCAGLWTDLDMYYNIPQRHLDSSRALPLSLYWSNYERGPEHVSLDRYSSYFPRARFLAFHGMPEDNGVQAFQGITSLPLLEELQLYPSNDNPLAEIFVSGHFPKLICLQINLRRGFEWRYTMFSSNLRSLYLGGLCMDRDLALTEFLDGLRNMPLLQCLQLYNVIGDSGVEEVSSSASFVSLEKLELLCLGPSLEECTTVLKHLIFPVSANIHIECGLEADDAEQLSVQGGAMLTRLSEALGAKLALRDTSGLLLSPLKYMVLQEDEDSTMVDVTHRAALRLRFMRDDQRFGQSLEQNLQFLEKVWHGKDAVDLDISRNVSHGIQIILSWKIAVNPVFIPLRGRFPEWICQSLPLEQVNTVSVNVKSNESWMDVWKFCPNITTVIARNNDTQLRPELRGLRNLLTLNTGEGDYRLNCLHFPNLQTLVLDHRMDFSKDKAPSVSRSDTCADFEDLRILSTLTLQTICVVTTVSKRDRAALALDRRYTYMTATSRNQCWLMGVKAHFPHVNIIMLDQGFSQWAQDVRWVWDDAVACVARLEPEPGPSYPKVSPRKVRRKVPHA